MSKSVIAIVGSATMDLTAYTDTVPEAGQTLLGRDFTTGFGGKGANQAVIAAHCGADVYFIGTLGRDSFGNAIAANFSAVGINTDYLERSDSPSGVAHIWVDRNGENRIIIVPGANHDIEIAKAVSAINYIPELAIVIAQCEIKQEVTIASFVAAKARGCITILNPAPFEELSPQLLEVTDWLIPNETEFQSITHTNANDDSNLANFRPGKNSIVTLGSQGAVLIGSDRTLTRSSAPSVHVEDTTGAGDAFVGTFAYGLASGMQSIDAVAFGIKVASLSVTRKGAQSSYPSQAEIKTLS